MRTLAVDASVTLKWVVPESGHADAVGLLDQYHRGEVWLIAPHLLLAEVGNALWKRVRRGELAAEQASRAFAELLSHCPILVHSESASQTAMDLSIAHGHPVYDCLYVALALEQRCDLITADRRLYQALGRTYSCVRLL
jgi:predicted nucleic acid-binding protein